MGNRGQTQFASRFPQESLPSHAVPPSATSADPIMSVLAQMMSKLTEVSGRLDRVEGAKAQCSDASTDQRDGRRIELPFQPLENPRGFLFLLLMLHAMYIDVIISSMSMLSFIEDNKRNEHGGEFSRKLQIFFKIFAFLHLVFYA